MAAGLNPVLSAIFQPTRPLRGATRCRRPFRTRRTDFNPRAPCGARHNRSRQTRTCWKISTHAPLAGRDQAMQAMLKAHRYFNPRAPCGARHGRLEDMPQQQFISTHAPLAGRDWAFRRYDTAAVHFNPRAPCGARLLWIGSETRFLLFQPTRPLRGATAKVYKSLCTFLR